MNSPKTLIEFMEMYTMEEDCRKTLFAHRWPGGFRCPRCGHERAYEHKKRPLFECRACGHQASLTAGTVLEGTGTDLKKWFLAIYLLAQAKKPISSAELGRQLGMATQTAWTLRRKIMHAMQRRQGELMLAGIVEMDESFVGGVSKGIRGRGATGKTQVAVMSEQNEGGGCPLAHMQVIESTSSVSLGGAAASYVVPGSVMATDGLPAYRGLAGLLPWTHIIISNFKRWILDAFHGVSAEHLQSCLDEFCYRFNRRKQRTDLFRRVLNRCARFTEPITYTQLTVPE